MDLKLPILWIGAQVDLEYSVRTCNLDIPVTIIFFTNSCGAIKVHFAAPDRYYQIDEIVVIGNIHDVNPAVKDSVTHTMKDPAILDPTTKQEEATNEQATNEQESAAQDKAMEVDSEEVTEG
jgi:hypothetical protein